MSSPLDSLLQAVKNSISDHAQQSSGFDASSLLGKVTELFGAHQKQHEGHDVKPASQDPYGDPADQPAGGKLGNVKPASQDPYGDPADQSPRR